jgi:hypothetical protein
MSITITVKNQYTGESQTLGFMGIVSVQELYGMVCGPLIDNLEQINVSYTTSATVPLPIGDLVPVAIVQAPPAPKRQKTHHSKINAASPPPSADLFGAKKLMCRKKNCLHTKSKYGLCKYHNRRK